MNDIPIVEVRVKSMEHTLLAAITAQEAKRDAWIAEALHEALEPENVKRVIADSVKRALDHVIAEEVDRYYRYGKGRDIVKRRIIEELEQR